MAKQYKTRSSGKGDGAQAPGSGTRKADPGNGADIGQAAQRLERPKLRWKVIAQVAAGFAVVWVTAFMAVPYVSYWGVGFAGVLTAVALGFGGYVWRLTRKSSALVEILQGATDAAGRERALAQLADGKGSDAMRALAKAQLLAQDRPQEAMATLEAIDLGKAPAVVQDDVRANLALLYLSHNRVRDARPLTAAMHIDRQPQPKAKALYAAVMAETMARSARGNEAKALLATFSPDDPAYGEARPLLLRAQVYTFSATKNRGLARRALEQLAAIDPRMVMPFAQRSPHAELQGLARQVLTHAGILPKAKTRMRHS